MVITNMLDGNFVASSPCASGQKFNGLDASKSTQPLLNILQKSDKV
jgi:ligand-binding sensor protein